jgi:N-acetylmuramidase/Putative peptidoglycan binding domain
MEFQGTGAPLNQGGLDQVCDSLRVTPPEVWAVVAVETRGVGFLRQRRPVILFERHIFHRRTGGRFDEVDSSISSPNSGAYKGGAAEYGRLEKAMVLDRQAALESTSWGIGQIMGFNHGIAGFATVEDMVDAMLKDETSQLLAVASFIKRNNLDGALRRQDFTAFARGYNGAGFAKNKYDARLAAAHAKFSTLLPDVTLRSIQVALWYVGFDPGPVDGVPGKITRSAVLGYQEKVGLPATGECDAATQAKLFAEAFPAAIGTPA